MIKPCESKRADFYSSVQLLTGWELAALPSCTAVIQTASLKKLVSL